MDNLHVELQEYHNGMIKPDYDFDKIIYDLNTDMSLLSSQADKYDYLISIGSGVLSSMLDIMWVGEFSLERGRDIASEEVDNFVIKTANLLGHESDDLQSSVRFLENKFPIPSDGNTPELGGSLQHHLRDFAHHPTIVGLMFSLLTQFTHRSYGTDTMGNFKVVKVTEASKAYIGKDMSSKLFNGTITWFFHLVSDMAGSSSTAGLSGGTGIPGPLLSLAKELSALPFFRKLRESDKSISKFVSKLFNGTLLAKRDGENKIIKGTELRFDIRGELGLGLEIGRQATPVVANECMVRSFYFIRRLAIEIQENEPRSVDELKQISWDKVVPHNDPTITRMLTIATGVFSTIDIGEAIVTQKHWISVNYIGIGRFAVAIGEDVTWGLKVRKITKIKQMYEDIQKNTFEKTDDTLYKKISADMTNEKFGLTAEHTEILYNLQYYKIRNDIRQTRTPFKTQDVKVLKHEWLKEWKNYITEGFSSFLQDKEAEMHWYTERELLSAIELNEPNKIWFRLVLLEAMMFEPYFPMSVEKNKKGSDIPTRKYKLLKKKGNGYNESTGDDYLDSFFSEVYYPEDYIRRLRKSYNSVIRELNEVLKTLIKSLSITAVITILSVATAGALAPSIAVALVGSNFAGLNGAALTAASLAYLGGGAVAAGGAGMAGGTIAVVGGGAVLGLGIGAGIGGTVGAAGLLDKRHTIIQSAKLLVSVREIFLTDEHDTEYSNTVYQQYLQQLLELKKSIVELRLKADNLTGDEKQELQKRLKNAEDTAKAMSIAKDNLKKYITTFEAETL
ncbi:hypothetical protein [Alkalibacterium pelagium]|uniref:Uncharacterized protein n=1 Tax=Alkalibacterium pelagium TaxID=426702 RepID=A0A1H7JXG5_9LACT|nr:hypothetical protein [Alkalibacterium pelagium]GEN50525.1 hypothetical protein APE02nite_11900 [Alkalibacterium pelagium]SEK78800.1 hypothetical protein SAMN04488099_10686 [Alkalibacterium pelagium]